MIIFQTAKRFFLFIFELLLMGPSYARFMFWSRSPRQLDADATWKRFTQPQNQYYEWLLRHYPPGFVRRFWAHTYPRFRNRVAGISQHYDISNDFYKLFLDQRYLFYTCADFLNNDDTLEVAQEHKANFILNLIDPQPGEKILDLGCGWGGMLNKIYQTTGDNENLLGYTLSHEQKEFIDEHYNFSVELQDVLSADFGVGYWDKIYSIGCMEHTPKSELNTLAQKLAIALKPAGKVVHHFFCQLDETPPARLLVCGAHLFPGVELSAYPQHLSAFEQANLKVVHHSLHDYRPTLAAWFERLVDHQAAAIALVGLPVYNKYLCYLAEAWRLFDDRDLVLMRFVLQHQTLSPVWQSPLYDEKASKVEPQHTSTPSLLLERSAP